MSDFAQRLELSNGSSNKFWEIRVSGSDYTVCYGAIGTSGRTQSKSFASPEAALEAARKAAGKKIKKGYAPVEGQSVGQAEAKPPAEPKPKAKPKSKAEPRPTRKAQAKPRAEAKPTARRAKRVNIKTKAFLKKLQSAMGRDVQRGRALLEETVPEQPWGHSLAVLYLDDRWELPGYAFALGEAWAGVEIPMALEVVARALAAPGRVRRRHVLDVAPGIWNFLVAHVAADPQAWLALAADQGEGVRQAIALAAAQAGVEPDAATREALLDGLAARSITQLRGWTLAQSLNEAPASWGRRTLPILEAAQSLGGLDALEEALVLAPFSVVMRAFQAPYLDGLVARVLTRREDAPEELVALLDAVAARFDSWSSSYSKTFKHLLIGALPRLAAAGASLNMTLWGPRAYWICRSSAEPEVVAALSHAPAEGLWAVFDSLRVKSSHGAVQLLAAAPDSERYTQLLAEFEAAPFWEFGELGGVAVGDLERVFDALTGREDAEQRCTVQQAWVLALRRLADTGAELPAGWERALIPHPLWSKVLGPPNLYQANEATQALFSRLAPEQRARVLAQLGPEELGYLDLQPG